MTERWALARIRPQGRCAVSPPPAPPGPTPGVGGTHPCDIYASSGTPCVAAHSTVRALYSAFDGALYAVIRGSDQATKAIPLLEAGGYANSTVQDEFCVGVTCNISLIFDQSGRGNHLGIYRRPTGSESMDGAAASILRTDTPNQDHGVNASRDKHVVGGHPVYSAFFETGAGYRNIQSMPSSQETGGGGGGSSSGRRGASKPMPANGTAVGDEPESMYMVTSGTHFNNHCCFGAPRQQQQLILP